MASRSVMEMEGPVCPSPLSRFVFVEAKKWAANVSADSPPNFNSFQNAALVDLGNDSSLS